MSKYIKIFCREAEEHLASLQGGLLELEKNPARGDLVHELLRNAHTLKGSARMVGLSDISAITHLMEEQLMEMEQGSRPVDAAGIDLLLKGTDAVALIATAVSRGEAPQLDVESFVAGYERGELGRTALAATAQGVAEKPGDTVRASVETLDSLVNLIGELIINKKRLEAKLSRLKEIVRDLDPAQAAPLTDFQRGLEEDVLYLDYLISELHEKAMRLRMLPFRSICDGLERPVRDLCQKLGKEARLEIVGASIEMDRLLLEGLKPMLLHLLTNAVSHGIETPGERLAAGKEREGTIRVTARHQAESVLVEIRDDGRGLDPEHLKARALARGVIGSREAQELSDQEALYLTLRPGFSTAETVTDVSGRGVGMDVVKKGVERIKGELALKSEPGLYCEIVLKLPLTLSVLGALVVQSGAESFAVPLSYVQEFLKIRDTDIATLGGREVIKVRGATTALFSLGRLLGLEEPQARGAETKREALVLKLCEERIALLVDAHLGNTEVVVKGLGGQFKNVEFVFGATILDDGNPALILNVPDLFAASAGAAHHGLRGAAEAQGAVRRRGRVLVVDDSITTRTMEQSILVSHGYQVQTAVSGEDALEQARAGRFDLVISDVEMPGINGFQLTRELRGLEAFRDTPIIMVSSLSRDEDKRQALDSGAQAYIVKGAFDQGLLLETVETLIG